MIVRNDDVLWASKAGKYKNKEVKRFKFIHEEVSRSGKLEHCPAILCKEIQQFPEAIEYIKYQTSINKMTPYLHAWDHETDYTKKSIFEIEDMIKKCEDWFTDNLNTSFMVWATPWGGKSENAYRAAERLGIRLETTAECIEPKDACRAVQEAGNIDILGSHTILYHWWNRGLSLFKITETATQGSWEAASQTRPEWF